MCCSTTPPRTAPAARPAAADSPPASTERRDRRPDAVAGRKALNQRFRPFSLRSSCASRRAAKLGSGSAASGAADEQCGHLICLRLARCHPAWAAWAAFLLQPLQVALKLQVVFQPLCFVFFAHVAHIFIAPVMVVPLCLLNFSRFLERTKLQHLHIGLAQFHPLSRLFYR